MKRVNIVSKLFATVTVILFGSVIASAQQPYGKYLEAVNNGTITIEVQGFSQDNHLISGTNVKYRVKATFWVAVPPDGGGGAASNGPYVTKIWITSVKTDLQGTVIPTPKPIDNSSTEHYFDVVFASTHFAHDTQLQVKGIASFHIEFTDATTQDRTIEVTVKPRTYNKGGLLATSVDNGGGEAATALACVEAVGPVLELMSHVVLPTPLSAAQSLNEAALDTILKESTVFFACTHGEPGAFWDSGSAKKYDRAKVEAVLAQRLPGTPGYNLVFIAGCKTALDVQGEELAAKFGMHANSVDKAYVGFKATLLVPGLDQYLVKVFKKLKSGSTISKAIEASAAGLPRSPFMNWDVTVSPVIYGDAQTKLINVYEGESWYRVS